MKNLIVSFSGGESSAFMAQWLKANKSDEYDMAFVFANTGEENEETLEFVEQCNIHFEFNISWIEARVYHGERKGSGHKHTDYMNASRNGEPFEDVIIKYGIPNQSFPHCTRELKINPIRSFANDYFGGQEYYTAIGIRVDEFDRMNENWKENRFIYPLISDIPTTKQQINIYWKQMPFRLNLKGYQGNCKTCWKKTDKKLYQIYKENPAAFNFMDRMERKFPLDRNGEKTTFFRGKRSATDIMVEADNWNGKIRNDSDDYCYQSDLLNADWSCEVYSNCGDQINPPPQRETI